MSPIASPALERLQRTGLAVGGVFLVALAAGFALDREQWAEAESLAREALALAEKVGRQELIASDCSRIAKALLEQDHNLEEALSLSRRAVEIFTHLKSPNLPWAQETLAKIEQALSGK